MGKLLKFFALGFILNFIWEPLHSRLYTHNGAIMSPATDFFWPMIIGAALLDALLITAIVSASKNFLITAVLGLSTAILIEKFALTTGIWAYAPSMPLVPILKTGLSPTLQLAATSLAAYFLIKR